MGCSSSSKKDEEAKEVKFTMQAFKEEDPKAAPSPAKPQMPPVAVSSTPATSTLSSALPSAARLQPLEKANLTAIKSGRPQLGPINPKTKEKMEAMKEKETKADPELKGETVATVPEAPPKYSVSQTSLDRRIQNSEQKPLAQSPPHNTSPTKPKINTNFSAEKFDSEKFKQVNQGSQQPFSTLPLTLQEQLEQISLFNEPKETNFHSSSVSTLQLLTQPSDKYAGKQAIYNSKSSTNIFQPIPEGIESLDSYRNLNDLQKELGKTEKRSQEEPEKDSSKTKGQLLDELLNELNL